MSRAFPRPAGVEVLANLLVGPDDPEPPPLPKASGAGVAAALERAMLPALKRSPCLVSFSGGRDSSAVLATAVDVARRHGLPDPLPAIMRFPGAPATDETKWQELVLEHLRLRDVAVLELREELDALGSAATGVLRRHGVIWPANTYMHMPILELAAGGSLLTGVGGDELFGTTASRHVLVAGRRVRPQPSDVRAFAAAVLPREVRRRLWLRRPAPPYPWLTASGRATVLAALARDEVGAPHRWDAAVHHWHRSRAFAGLDGALQLVAGGHDVHVVNPFLARPVLAEMAPAGGATGFPSRAAAMRQLFGSLLPDAVLTREAKAVFSGAVWGPAVRELVEQWGGEGVDETLVDVEALRREWLTAEPNFRTALVLHTAWTALHPSASSS